MKSKFLLIIVISSLLCSSCVSVKFLEPVDNHVVNPVEIESVQWNVTELSFASSKTYTSNFDDVDMDVIFTHSTGLEMRVPSFWENDSIWKVRFAPTLTGAWTYKTVCTDPQNTGLNNITGNLTCIPYTGNLDVYKHGFVKTTPSNRYFTYNDDTPFFYLGDTHWNFPANTFTNFSKIIDKRVGQGFTVIQTQPLGAKYNLSNGITHDDSLGFADLDRRFKYIADNGLVHSNSQLFWVGELSKNREKYTDAYLEKLCRYWVARYSAYPVMWTTAQECDNDFYAEWGDIYHFDVATNPWKLVADYINKYDPYKHPQTAHMEYVSYTNASNSSFKILKGHSWFAVQWAPSKIGPLDFNVPKDFWNNGQGKPAPNFEGLYDHLWTLEFGARMQGWTAYLNGMYGCGYGAADVWLYNSTYDMDQPTFRDNITISVSEKHMKWQESMELPSAYQMGYMHEFFNSIEWWSLIPRFDDTNWFSSNGSWYSLASKGNDLYVVYFYNNIDLNTGTLKNLANTQYSLQWFSPITGKYSATTTVTITNGLYIIGNKPDKMDWVLLMRIK
ncbi:MAG: DUF4038 domain-containing protein [Mariniphaga sp.]